MNFIKDKTMKNLIAFSSVCLAGLLISSCATSGAIADNDVYLQQPTASVLLEDETDPTSFANYKAQEREEIIVTRNVLTPFTMNVITTNYYNPFNPVPFGYNAFPYYTMYNNHMMYNNYYGWGNTFYYGYGTGFQQYGFYGYYSPYQWGYNPYNNFYANNYYGYGQYSNGFGNSGNNQASHNTNHFYQHRTSATVGAPRNSNYPSTLKSAPASAATTVNRPYSVNQTPATQTASKTVRRNIGSGYQVGNGSPRTPANNSGSSASTNGRPSYSANNTPSKRPAQTYSTPQSSPSASTPRTTQPINGTSRRGSTSGSGRSTTLGTTPNGNGGTVSTPRRTSSTPSTYSGGGSSRSSGSSGSSGGARRSSGGGSSSTTSGRR